MRVHIMTDLEGVSGVNGRSDGIGNKILNEDVAGRLLTEEVNAAVEGLVEGGATEIVVVDGHGGSNMIQPEKLHPAAKLIILGGGMAPIMWIDAGYVAALHLGAHAMIGVRDGFLNHTFNSHAVVNMWLNDRLVGEIAIEALRCACLGVPTILVSGDRAACREAREFLKDVETVETKVGLSRYTVINENPVKVRADLRERAKWALQNKARFQVQMIPPPYALKIQLMCPNQADIYEMRGARRLDHQTVLLESHNFLDLWAQRNGWAPGVHNKYFA